MIQQMPSPVGHVLVGIAVGSLAARDQRWGLPLACGLAATLADVDFLLPVPHRGPTHSLSAGVAAFLVLLAIVRAPAWGLQPRAVAGVIACAVTSHVLLDWLGQDSSNPRGLMAFWPFSREYYISDLNVFDAVDRRYWREGFWRHNLIAVTKEVVILCPLTLLALNSRRSRGQSSARGDRRRPSA